jgi:DNA repair ATPase RecN
MKLHEITNEIQRVMDLLVEHEGELCPEAETLLGRLEEDLHRKTDGYCKAVRILEAQAAVAKAAADQMKAECNRLGKLAQARSNSAERLKDWLKTNLQRLGMTKVETDLFVVRIQKNGRPAIPYTGDVKDLPEGFRKVTITPDGDAAYAAWKAGKELPAGFTVIQSTHLRIQ